MSDTPLDNTPASNTPVSSAPAHTPTANNTSNEVDYTPTPSAAEPQNACVFGSGDAQRPYFDAFLYYCRLGTE